jgi:hypothetical protein
LLRAGIVSAAIGCVLLFATGCGSSPADPPAPQGSQPTPGTSASPTGRIGESLTLPTDDTVIEARVQKIMDPLEVGRYDKPMTPGNRFVGVELAIRNVGEQSFSGSLVPAVQLITSTDRQAPLATPAGGDCAGSFVIDVRISAGDRRVGCLAFELPKDEKAAAFQFTVKSGNGPPNTAEWNLG